MQQSRFIHVFTPRTGEYLKRKNMKNLKFIITIVLCISITSCIDAQLRKTVYGNNKVIKRDRTAEPFTAVRVSSGIDVYLSQGDKISLSVEADENLHEYILTEVSDGVLRVYTEVNIREAEMKKVYVTMKEVRALSTSSAGDLIGETPVRSDELRLSASSAGDIKIEVYAKNIDTDISSSGDVTLTGEADMLDASLSSAGDLNAFNLKVREAEVSASSAGNADVYVTERIVARASSAGDINYKGDPKHVDAHSSSAGGVHKR